MTHSQHPVRPWLPTALLASALLLALSCGEKGVETGQRDEPEKEPAPGPVASGPAAPTPADLRRKARELRLKALRGSRGTSRPGPWDGKGRLKCSGNETYTIKDKTLQGHSLIIEAVGMCKVTLVNVNLSDTSNAIRVADKATLTMTGGSIDARFIAIKVKGDGSATVTNVKLKGRFGLRVEDRGKATVTGGSLEGKYSGLLVENEGQATLTNVSVKGRAGIRASQKARVHVVGGTVKGTYAATQPRDTAVITYTGTKFDGKHRRSGTGVTAAVTKDDDPAMIASAAQAHAVHLARYEKGGCDGVIDCYLDHGSFGAISGTVEMPITKTGTVRRPKIKVRGANGKTKRCLRKLAKAKTIADFKGPPGKLVCSFSGQVGRGFRMLSIGASYVADAKKGKRRKR